MYKVSTNGTITSLVSFAGTNGSSPFAGLTQGSDGNFYGTTQQGGSGSAGTVFRFTTNGTLTNLANFATTNGAGPASVLMQGPDGNFYGTTSGGGSSSSGTIFLVTSNGALSSLASFAGTNGANPKAGLILGPDGNFYGTTEQGGSGGAGVAFRLDLPPRIISNLPASQAVFQGGNATFTVSLFGTAPYTYQWFSNSIPISGGASGSLVVSNVVPSSAGSYQVVITNSWGSATSIVANLTVVVPPTVTGFSYSANANGSLTLNLATTPNFTSRVYATTNLDPPINWQPIFTNVNGGAWQFTDTNAAAGQRRFYWFSSP